MLKFIIRLKRYPAPGARRMVAGTRHTTPRSQRACAADRGRRCRARAGAGSGARAATRARLSGGARSRRRREVWLRARSAAARGLSIPPAAARARFRGEPGASEVHGDLASPRMRSQVLMETIALLPNARFHGFDCIVTSVDVESNTLIRRRFYVLCSLSSLN